jgi:peptidoglycan/xylan/chitin deacetylase (PgdA/CDA1 family)
MKPIGLGRLVPRPLRRAACALEGRLLGGVITMGPRRPEVALTFDDGPSPAHTAAILDVLRDQGARATFFVLGAHVEAHPDLARRIAAEQELACHSYGHTRDLARSRAAFRADMARFREVVAREVGTEARFYRFPWGDPGAIAPADVMAEEGMRCVHWSMSSGDDELSAEGILGRIEEGLAPGAIFLLHDGVAPHSVRPRSRHCTVEAMPRILERIRARGLRGVTVGELLRES